MPTLLMLKGLPASGKSSYARSLTNYVRVNKDDLRAMLNDGKWSKSNENFVLTVRDFIVSQALSYGKNVVVDDTNFAPFHEKRLRELAKEHNAKFEVKFFDVPLAECIERDLKRPNSVGENVIRGMYNKYLRPRVSENDPTLRSAFICDLDGTLALMEYRGPYEWDKCDTDVVCEPVKAVVRAVALDHRIVIVSGRDGSAREKTRKWLTENDIPHDELHMRKAGDTRRDSEVKKEIYHNKIKGRCNVIGVVDDRPQVIDECWHELGLFVFDVNQERVSF